MKEFLVVVESWTDMSGGVGVAGVAQL